VNHKLIDAKELGEEITMPLQSVWRLTREKIFPHYRIGHLIRYDLQEVLDALRVEGRSGNDKVDN
jgi:hypothetical protein